LRKEDEVQSRLFGVFGLREEDRFPNRRGEEMRARVFRGTPEEWEREKKKKHI